MVTLSTIIANLRASGSIPANETPRVLYAIMPIASRSANMGKESIQQHTQATKANQHSTQCVLKYDVRNNTRNDHEQQLTWHTLSGILETLRTDSTWVDDSVISGAYGNYQYGVRFTSGSSANGEGQRMDTSVNLSDASAMTAMAVFELDNWVPSIIASQWDTNSSLSSWILAPSTAQQYGEGGDGFRFWFQTPDAVTAAQLNLSPLPASGERVQIVARYDGTQANEADRVTIWYATGSMQALVTGSMTIFDLFGTTTIPTTLPSTTTLMSVGGATYSTAAGMNGMLYDLVIWRSALSNADVLSLRSAGLPIDPTILNVTASHHWLMGNGIGDSGTRINDAAGGISGSLTNGGDPASNPFITTSSL